MDEKLHMKHFLFFGILFFLSIDLKAQYEIKGQIIDTVSKKGVDGAHIIELHSTNGTKSDPNGFFLFKSKQKFPVLKVSHVAYADADYKTSKKNKDSIVILMNRANYAIGEINLNPDKILQMLEHLKCDTSAKINKNIDSTFIIVEEIFEYPGGWNCLDYLFLSNLYPYISSQTITPFGDLELNFNINESGLPIDITVNKGISNQFLDILNSVFQKMQRWKPASQNGKKITVNLTYRLKYE